MQMKATWYKGIGTALLAAGRKTPESEVKGALQEKLSGWFRYGEIQRSHFKKCFWMWPCDSPLYVYKFHNTQYSITK